MLRVVCLKWGDKYGSDYVNRLKAAVTRNIKQPFTFHCLTEDPAGLEDDIHVIPLPEIELEGWWLKLLLFKQGFLPFDSQDLVLYLDLDVVILQSLEPLIEAGEAADLLAISADDTPDRMNSSVMVFRPCKLEFVWAAFDAQRHFIMDKFHGDQDWIERIVPSAFILPKSMVCSFKIDLNSKTPFSFGALGRWFRRRFPKVFMPRGIVDKPHCSIVLFHGKPDPHDVMDGPWDKYRHAPWIGGFWL